MYGIPPSFNPFVQQAYPILLPRQPFPFFLPPILLPGSVDLARLQLLHAEFLSPQVAAQQMAQPAAPQDQDEDEVVILSATLAPRNPSHSPSSNSAAARPLTARSPRPPQPRATSPRLTQTAATTASLLQSSVLPGAAPSKAIKRGAESNPFNPPSPHKKAKCAEEGVLDLLATAAECVDANPRISFELTLQWLTRVESALSAPSQKIPPSLIKQMPRFPSAQFFDNEAESTALQTLCYLIKTMALLPSSEEPFSEVAIREMLMKDPDFQKDVLKGKCTDRTVRYLVRQARDADALSATHRDAKVLLRKARAIESKLYRIKNIFNQHAP